MSQSSAPAPTVFIVETMPTSAQCFGRTLQRAGYIIVSAAHGRDALQQLKSNAIDIVITDIP